MRKYLNDPKINRTYNYLYKIVNKINNKFYIGVHRTDNMNDGYMGSGKHLKRSIAKYGVENFEKTIIENYKTYQEALDAERGIVTPELIERSDNYNQKEGGFGSCKWSAKSLELLSTACKNRWKSEEYRILMRKYVYDNPKRNIKLGSGIKEWIKNNPEKHIEKMLKINKNPEKIKKMADKHRGMKRSEEAKKNIRSGILKSFDVDVETVSRRVGKGSFYIYNEITNQCKRHDINNPMPQGWTKGVGKRITEKYIFIYNPLNNKIKRHLISQEIPTGWFKGGGKKNRKPKNG